jgi:hypothetical protein
MRLPIVAFLVLFPILTPLSLKVEKVAAPVQLSKAVEELLEPQAYRIFDSANQQLLTFWLRKEIPLDATGDQIANGITYREVVPGSLIGCLEVHQPWIDFRKQEVKPGIYTLRLAIQPATGDHEGTAPHSEFCIICPAEKDATVEPMDLKKLVDLSSKVTGTAHPSVMLLFPVRKPEDVKEAKLESPKEGIQTLIVIREGKAETAKCKFGFAFTVEGVRDK